jgi:hypothetical protein
VSVWRLQGANTRVAPSEGGLGGSATMAFSVLYLAFRALLGALVRTRRGPDVKDIELLVLARSSRSCVARWRGPSFAVLIAPCSRPRPATCHANCALRVWSPRARYCGGIGHSCAESAGSRPAGEDARPCRLRCGPWCFGWHARIRVGAIGGSAASWPNSASQCRHPRFVGCLPAESPSRADEHASTSAPR